MKWIKLSERLPEKREKPYKVLLFQVDTILAPPLIFVADWDGEEFWDDRFEEVQTDVISHWCHINYPEDKE